MEKFSAPPGRACGKAPRQGRLFTALAYNVRAASAMIVLPLCKGM
jgi:hypothetical protein